jgi:NAD(P)-dependent dehydrogenase (short-subunit alcohol dehydrogenase family)
MVVLITGASSGIGAALARAWVREGADLVLLARRVDRLEALAAECRASGRRALVMACDVTRDGDVERAVARAREELGRIDVVVANAGFGVVGPLESLGLEDYRRQLETNVFGVLRTIYASLDELKRTRGRLVIIGSVSGHLAMPGGSPYAMSKFAVRALAKSLGHELARHGVSVTLISPGYVASEIHQVDNRGIWHPDARATIPRWLEMPTATAARKIVRAAARRRREIVITGHGKLAVFLERHVPWLIAAGVRGFGIKARSDARPDAGC